METEKEVVETTEVNTEVETTENELPQSYIDKYGDNEAARKIHELESNIYKKKKEAKESPKTPTTELDIEKILEKREFLKANPELQDKIWDIEVLTSSGLTFDEAKDVIIKRDPTIAERQKTNSMNMTWDRATWPKAYTKEDLWKMNRDEYARAMKDIESWEASRA